MNLTNKKSENEPYLNDLERNQRKDATNMGEALIVAGAIFFHAGWMHRPHRNNNVAAPVYIGVALMFVGVAVSWG